MFVAQRYLNKRRLSDEIIEVVNLQLTKLNDALKNHVYVVPEVTYCLKTKP